ncbi:YCF48-related protein [Owenweeksia hongkongensis]|uniref:YCF48-related protein n=1 Tax=Owenweeksia hongkongensis TaxID=253245 RepID=UPI003A8F8C1E
MKNKYFLLAISCLLSLSSFSQWQLVDSISNGSFQCLHFVNSDTGFAYNDWATLRRTTDGGNSWDTVSIAFDSYMYDIDFANPNVGYAVGGAWFPFNKYYANSIMKTTDGGLNWDSVYGNSSGGVFYDVEVVSPNEFYAVGDYMMVHSTDGGATLDTFSLSAPLESFSKIEFVSPQHGYLLGRTYVQTSTYLNRLYETTDGGSTWQVVHSDTLGYQGFTDFVIDASGNGILFGEKGQVRSNQGSGWNIVSLVDTSLIFTMAEMADGRIYAIGDGGGTKKLFETSDFGNTWGSQLIPVDSNNYVVDMSFPNGGVGYFMTNRHVYKNSALISIVEEKGLLQLEVFPNPTVNTVSVSLPVNEDVAVQLTNISGSLVKEMTFTDVNTFEVNLEGEPAGIYLLNVIAGGQNTVVKLIKK